MKGMYSNMLEMRRCLFTVRDNVKKICQGAIHCSKNIIEVWKYVNPAVKSYGLLPITAKVAFDDGGALVVSYGKKLEKSHVDIVGRTISIVAKMLPYAKLTRIIAGQSIYDTLSDHESKELFTYCNAEKQGWSYNDERNASPYKLYSLM